MILEGEFTIEAPRERVWASVWDIPTMASWVPGCTSAVALSEDTYRVILEQKVAFLSTTFDMLLRVVDVDAPNSVRLHGDGEDRRIKSSLQIDSAVDLRDSDLGTTIRYRHDISIFGRLGAIGFPLIQQRSKELEAEFVRRATASLTRTR